MNLIHRIAFSGVLTVGAASAATATANVPAGSTGLCKDGSYTTNETKKGACSGHKGVKAWFAGESSKALTPPNAPDAATAPTSPGAASTPMKPLASKAASTPAAGGGAGKVWVNSSSHVYHCAGTKYYGTTKEGTYLTEAEAKAAGNHADHGKDCS